MTGLEAANTIIDMMQADGFEAPYIGERDDSALIKILNYIEALRDEITNLEQIIDAGGE